MAHKILSAELSKRAFQRLDELLEDNVVLLLGGGGAMILAHGFPLATSDIDAVPQGTSVSALDKWVKQIALELGLPGDWLNPYFSTFLHTLPSDYSERLIEVFKGARLKVRALGATDMLILKCFAARQKDIGHAKALLKRGADVKRIEKHLESLSEKKIPGVERALEFLDDLLDQV